MNAPFESVDRKLVEAVLSEVAPDEIELLDEILAPQRAVTSDDSETALEFGVPIPLDLFAPLVLSVSTAFHEWLGDELAKRGLDIAKDLLSERLKKWLSRRLGDSNDDISKTVAPDKLLRMREILREIGARQGLSRRRSEDIANAFIAYISIGPL